MLPQVFINPDAVVYKDKRQALADAYSGWCCFCAGEVIPHNFGMGMVKIYDYLGFVPTPLNPTTLKDKMIGD